jgi:hypothetical protein
MMKTTGLAMVLAAAVAGVGCEGSETASPAPPKVDEPQAPAGDAIVHASLSLGGEHVLDFVEFKGGDVGVIEKGRNMIDAPTVTNDLSKLPWLKLYRHFAGDSATIPEKMKAADLRASALAREALSTPAPRELDGARLSSASSEPAAPSEIGTKSAGEGPHFYNDAEQAWYRDNLCNGARDCVQGWAWTRIVSSRKLGTSWAGAMVGSEGFTSTFSQAYWTCTSVPWPYPNICIWIEQYKLTIAPGGWASITHSGGNVYLQWVLNGAGSGAQVSSSAYY